MIVRALLTGFGGTRYTGSYIKSLEDSLLYELGRLDQPACLAEIRGDKVEVGLSRVALVVDEVHLVRIKAWWGDAGTKGFLSLRRPDRKYEKSFFKSFLAGLVSYNEIVGVPGRYAGYIYYGSDAKEAVEVDALMSRYGLKKLPLPNRRKRQKRSRG